MLTIALTILGVAFVACAALIVVGLIQNSFTEAAERREVQHRLETISGITVLDVSGEVDIGITATVEVSGHGVLTFYVTPDSFDNAERLAVSRIGGVTFMKSSTTLPPATTCPTDRIFYYAGAMDVSEHSSIPALAALGIKTISDLVNRYEQLAAVVDDWPEFPEVTSTWGHAGILLCFGKRTAAIGRNGAPS